MMWMIGALALAAEPSMDFLKGCWVTAPDASFTATEVWVGPTQGVLTGTLLGAYKGNPTWEHFVIAPKGGVPTMTVMPKGQAAVDFALTAHSPGKLLFANPAHDFPRNIRYEKVATGLMVMADDGLPEDSGGKSLRLDYRPCP